MNIYFEWIFYYSQWQRIFCLLETIQILLETVNAIRGKPLFLKNSYFCYCSGNCFLQFFWDTDLNGNSFSVQWNSHFSRNLSFWLVEMDFWLITSFRLLFGAFSCWWMQCLKFDVNQFSSNFFIPNSGSSFSG